MNGNQPNALLVFNHTVVGSSHTKADKPCQDYSFAEFNPDEFSKIKKKYAIAVVADGHGSSDYFRSDRGSQMACVAAKESVRLLMQDNNQGLNTNKGISDLLENPDEYMDRLKKSIITLWRNAVAEDYAKESFSQKELDTMSVKKRIKFLENQDQRYVDAYGTTLIVIVKHTRFWFGLHIGDGKCVACYPDFNIIQPIPWDERNFLNITTSLCNEDALVGFRHTFFKDNFPDALYIATDGVDDSFGTDENLYDFYRKLTESFIEKGKEGTMKELNMFLPQLSEKGSGDDISIAGILKEKKVLR